MTDTCADPARSRKRHFGPFDIQVRKKFAYDDTEHSSLFITLDYGNADLPHLYFEQMGKSFWKEAEEILKAMGAKCYYNYYEDCGSYLDVSGVNASDLDGVFDGLRVCHNVPKLQRMIRRKLEHDWFKTRAWIFYTAKYGLEEALRMEYEEDTINASL